MKKIIKSSTKFEYYYGREASEKYGDMISEALSGKTVSKLNSKIDEPGGLRYESEQLGIGMFDLLDALEGMCYEGRAEEIDDSTYRVL